MSCGVGCRHGSDPVLLWLWRRPVATAAIKPLAWGPPYAARAAHKRQKDKKKGGGGHSYTHTLYMNKFHNYLKINL